MLNSILSSRQARPIGKALANLAALAFAVCMLSGCGVAPSPADIQGNPVRATTPAGDRVFILTSQWKTYRSGGFRGSIGSSYTDLLIDVWAFDAASAKPVWRQRLTQQRSGVNMGRDLLGVSGGKLWVVQPTGLVGLSVTDGAVAADVGKIEAANPALRTLLPTEVRYYRFDTGGLSFTAADGRAWRLNGEDLRASAAAEAPAQPAPGVFLPAHIGGGNGTWAFMERGLLMRTQWLGLLDEAEAGAFRSQGAIGGIDPQGHPRTRLWSAKVGSKSTFFGPKPTFGDFKPLPEGPEFLQAGVLSDGRVNSPPILLFKPDSVLVLHRDRLGEEGHLRLSRITGPAGKPAWTVDLPFERLESVMPGETSVVLYGERKQPDPNRSANSSNVPIGVDQIVAIDYATGAMGVYGLLVKATKPEDIPPSGPQPPAKP